MTVPNLSPRSVKTAATRESIIVEASKLFAIRGYFGTSTRDIADAVGVRQPTIFFHFSNKQAIVEELLHYSLEAPVDVAHRLLSVQASGAARVYRYVWFDTHHLLNSPYDLTGVHGEDLIDLPEFAQWRKLAQRLRKDIQGLLREGQNDGSLRKMHVRLTQQLISGMNLNTMRMAHAGRPSQRVNIPAFVSDFILRATLSDVELLPQVATEALAIEI